MQIQICFVGSIYLWEYVRLEKSPVEEISFGEVSVAEVSVEDLFLEKYQSDNSPVGELSYNHWKQKHLFASAL